MNMRRAATASLAAATIQREQSAAYLQQCQHASTVRAVADGWLDNLGANKLLKSSSKFALNI